MGNAYNNESNTTSGLDNKNFYNSRVQNQIWRRHSWISFPVTILSSALHMLTKPKADPAKLAAYHTMQ